ncbi:hypothetical protein HGA91_01295 [candidate division WWE3 bacterium]|nr:hypothetical protein [candidate division WWE3 bacterium]
MSEVIGIGIITGSDGKMYSHRGFPRNVAGDSIRHFPVGTVIGITSESRGAIVTVEGIVIPQNRMVLESDDVNGGFRRWLIRNEVRRDDTDVICAFEWKKVLEPHIEVETRYVVSRDDCPRHTHDFHLVREGHEDEVRAILVWSAFYKALSLMGLDQLRPSWKHMSDLSIDLIEVWLEWFAEVGPNPAFASFFNQGASYPELEIIPELIRRHLGPIAVRIRALAPQEGQYLLRNHMESRWDLAQADVDAWSQHLGAVIARFRPSRITREAVLAYLLESTTSFE